ncbi:uncharacterized protein N7487_000632 [Penicillium crustosum]|uniref:uncharacterized protein n=1 Tax=Penicillium crustosum TaxID=36656 RepID=UPI00238DBC3D|nr:uncharacterized protein N7487_000632 [Penicillium crustosum]KAJ5417082.1 hypothetical protein N7487_000632 [Penicillium crustosum]
MLANVERNVNPSQVAYDVPGIWAGKIPYLQELVPEQTAREDWSPNKAASNTARGRRRPQGYNANFESQGLGLG